MIKKQPHRSPVAGGERGWACSEGRAGGRNFSGGREAGRGRRPERRRGACSVPASAHSIQCGSRKTAAAAAADGERPSRAAEGGKNTRADLIRAGLRAWDLRPLAGRRLRRPQGGRPQRRRQRRRPEKEETATGGERRGGAGPPAAWEPQ